MILSLTEDVARIGIRIKDWRNNRILQDWRNVILTIMPGQADSDCTCDCHIGGSPWYLHGCWPGHRVDVDVANPAPPDFAPIVCRAFTWGEDGTVEFHVPDVFRTLPWGRYTGVLQYHPALDKPLDFRVLRDLRDAPRPANSPCVPDLSIHSPAHMPPVPLFCVLARFDIDYGPRCSEHIIDMAQVQFMLGTCDEEV